MCMFLVLMVLKVQQTVLLISSLVLEPTHIHVRFYRGLKNLLHEYLHHSMDQIAMFLAALTTLVIFNGRSN